MQVYSELRIIKAEEEHLDSVVKVTKDAFMLYQVELGEGAAIIPALKETQDEVLNDIKKHQVIIAIEDGVVVGALRYQMLTDSIAYVYRFGVVNEQSGSGIGTKLLEAAIKECTSYGAKIMALHTNSKYYKLARYYYGKGFYVHSTTTHKGYIRALFIKELTTRPEELNLAPVHNM